MEIYQRKLNELQKYLILNSKDAEAYSKLGYLHENASLHDLAILAFQRAHELSPKDINHLIALGKSHLNNNKKKNIKLAIESFDKAEKMCPNESQINDILKYSCTSYQQLGDPQLYLQFLDKKINQYPDVPLLHIKYMSILESQEKWNQLFNHFLKFKHYYINSPSWWRWGYYLSERLLKNFNNNISEVNPLGIQNKISKNQIGFGSDAIYLPVTLLFRIQCLDRFTSILIAKSDENEGLCQLQAYERVLKNLLNTIIENESNEFIHLWNWCLQEYEARVELHNIEIQIMQLKESEEELDKILYALTTSQKNIPQLEETEHGGVLITQYRLKKILELFYLLSKQYKRDYFEVKDSTNTQRAQIDKSFVYNELVQFHYELIKAERSSLIQIIRICLWHLNNCDDEEKFYEFIHTSIKNVFPALDLVPMKFSLVHKNPTIAEMETFLLTVIWENQTDLYINQDKNLLLELEVKVKPSQSEFWNLMLNYQQVFLKTEDQELKDSVKVFNESINISQSAEIITKQIEHIRNGINDPRILIKLGDVLLRNEENVYENQAIAYLKKAHAILSRKDVGSLKEKCIGTLMNLVTKFEDNSQPKNVLRCLRGLHTYEALKKCGEVCLELAQKESDTKDNYLLEAKNYIEQADFLATLLEQKQELNILKQKIINIESSGEDKKSIFRSKINTERIGITPFPSISINQSATPIKTPSRFPISAKTPLSIPSYEAPNISEKDLSEFNNLPDSLRKRRNDRWEILKNIKTVNEVKSQESKIDNPVIANMPSKIESITIPTNPIEVKTANRSIFGSINPTTTLNIQQKSFELASQIPLIDDDDDDVIEHDNKRKRRNRQDTDIPKFQFNSSANFDFSTSENSKSPSFRKTPDKNNHTLFASKLDSEMNTDKAFTFDSSNLGSPTEKKSESNNGFSFGATPFSFSLNKKPESTEAKSESNNIFSFGDSKPFSFGSSDNKLENKALPTETKSESNIFSFGATKPFSFGSSENKPEPTETKAEPSFSFGTSKPESTEIKAEQSFSFGASKPESTETKAEPRFSFGASKLESTETKAESSFLIGNSKQESTETKAEQSFSFGFGSSDNKSETNKGFSTDTFPSSSFGSGGYFFNTPNQTESNKDFSFKFGSGSDNKSETKVESIETKSELSDNTTKKDNPVTFSIGTSQLSNTSSFGDTTFSFKPSNNPTNFSFSENKFPLPESNAQFGLKNMDFTNKVFGIEDTNIKSKIDDEEKFEETDEEYGTEDEDEENEEDNEEDEDEEDDEEEEDEEDDEDEDEEEINEKKSVNRLPPKQQLKYNKNQIRRPVLRRQTKKRY